MAKRKYSAVVIILLVLLFIRFVGNIIPFVLSLDIGSLIVAIIYAIALWGVYTVKKWGYLVTVGFSIIDIILVAIIGGTLSTAFNFGAIAVDLVILVLAVIEYQKLKK